MISLLYLALSLAISASTALSLPSLPRICSSRQILMAMSSPTIALTRENGANDKLSSLLKDYECVEIPCIEFELREDASRLQSELLLNDIIAITSPQSASIFIEAWSSAGKPPVKVVTVGKGTSIPLEKVGILPAFTPSDFNAETLALELPTELGIRVLYPTSALAENTLQAGLERRGFQVRRMNTYSTVPAKWTAEQLETAQRVDIVTFASPSAVKTWAERAGTDFAVVAIGPGCAKAAESAGFREVFCPAGSKGVEAWAREIERVASSLKL